MQTRNSESTTRNGGLNRLEQAWKQASLIVALVVMIIAVLSFPAAAQDYSQEIGRPTFTSGEPVELGFINAGNGNLHLEIPIASLPQRASGNLVFKLEYDSRLWYLNGTNVWSLNTWATNLGGWRLAASNGSGTSGGSSGWGGPCGGGSRGGYANYFWTSPEGTTHYFPIQTVNTDTCGGNLVSSGAASAQDSSGYYMAVSNFQVASVVGPDGTQVFPSIKDANGNFYSADTNGNVIDTLGRKPLVVTNNCNNNAHQICYDVLNSQGTTSRYIVTTETIAVHTAFGISQTTEYSGNITAVQSVQLPDGTSYSFGYDFGTTSGHYGEITSATLRTGAQINYSYAVFQDALGSKNRWVTQRVSGGNTWTYALNNVSTGTKTQQVTVTKPSGDYKNYAFNLNNGAWVSSVQFFGSGGGAPLATISDNWDMSNTCQSPCNGSGGAINVRKLGETTTFGSVTKQTQFTYSGLASSVPQIVKEWNYYSGSAPASPQKTTTITYLSDSNPTTYGPTGKNMLNRPTSIVVTDGSGNKLKETDITYDNTTLTSATNFTQHDDTNFGTSNTARGIPTNISTLVTGTTFLPTATLSYDTTGNLIKSIDSNSNATQFSYTDCFANDNGSNPPSSISPAATNAYPTTTTLPVSGTLKACYYYGSGKTAYTKDQNSATTYHHFQDFEDRETTEYLPIGWQLNKYTSATQIDTYLGIQDASPSITCTSCRHDQTLGDNLGRTIDQILVSDPDGQTTVKTDYDANGRVLDTSHPYRSTSDSTYGFETASYDGLDRPTQVTHQDGTVKKIYYGRYVTAAGGLLTQTCGSCGLGYPTLTVDEAGKTRQVWTDAFGKTVEVDEPASTASTGGSGTATGTITFNGAEQSTVINPCQNNVPPAPTYCPQTIYDAGTFSVTVGGLTESVGWNNGLSNTPSSIASATASAFNSDPASPVTASAAANVVTFSAKFNYTLGPASTTWISQFFASPSFSATTSGGNLTNGVPPQLSSPTVTYYLYDPLERLTQVTVVGGTEANRSYAYDSLSRMISATEPETGNGTSSHTTTFSYTISTGALCSGDTSSVCTRSDGRGITTTYSYDTLNRPKGMTYSDGTTPSVTYFYDQTSYNGLTITNGLGRRTGMSDGSGQTAWSYDANGNILKETRTIAGITASTSYAYNGDNSLKTLTYPSGRVVNYTVGNAQRVTAVADTNGTNYVSPPSTGPMYAPSGGLESAVYGKGSVFTGLTESRTFNNRVQLSGITASSSAGTGLNLAFGFTSSSHPSNNGEILSITNNVDTGRTESLTYDDLSRLVSGSSQATSGSDCWGQNYTLDAVANLTNISLSQCSGTTLSTAVSSNNQFTSGYAYDAGGNMTSDGIYAYTYNAENEITSANGVTYTYDGNRMRVEKTGGTLYWRDVSGNTIAETNLSGATQNIYVFFAGRRLVQRSNSSGNYYYYQVDQTGTTRSITQVTSAGAASICYDADFTPFGSEMTHTNSCTWAPHYKFTGYERDTETGLDYAFNRYYNPRLGRFMSPDPSGATSANYANPQTMNRYAYALNNPMSNIDPTGLFCVWDDGSYDDDAGSGGDTQGQCGSDGGTWFDGTSPGANFDPNSFVANMVAVAENMGWAEVSWTQQVEIAVGLKAGFSVADLTSAFSSPGAMDSIRGFARSLVDALDKFSKSSYAGCVDATMLQDAFWGAITQGVAAIAVPTVAFAIGGSDIGPEGTVAGAGLGLAVGVGIAPAAMVSGAAEGGLFGTIHGAIGCAFSR